MNGITVAAILRQLSGNPYVPCPFLVEERRQWTEDEDWDFDRWLLAFTEKAKQFPATGPQGEKRDVYLGMWCEDGQFTLTLPVELLALVGERGWPVMVDCND